MDASDLPKQLSALVPFNRHVGVEVLEAAGGSGVARLVESPVIVNHVGTVHAGALFTLADAASGAAVVGMFADAIAALSLVVRDAEIAFLRPARGTVAAVATARETRSAIDARLERDGRAETGVDVSLTADGVEVARVHVRWYLRRR